MKVENINLDLTKLHPRGSIEKLYLQMKEDLRIYWDKDSDSLDLEKVEEVRCSLCDSLPPSASTALFKKYHFPYLRCPHCFLVYVSPRPKLKYIEEQYKKGRFTHAFRDIYLPSAQYRMATIFRERVEDIIMPRVRSGRLLDIGCSSGHFLKVAYEHNFDIYGIEPNPDMAKFASEELRLPNIKCGILKDDTYPGEYFDVITLWDVLEHVLNPNELLRLVFSFLKQDGWVFAYTENLDSFNFFITGSDSEMFAPDVHLRHYTPNTFRAQFEKAGFLVREVITNGLDIQHIETTIRINGGKYPAKELQYIFKQKNKWQAVINALGKGDNLRLFAQKP